MFTACSHSDLLNLKISFSMRFVKKVTIILSIYFNQECWKSKFPVQSTVCHALEIMNPWLCVLLFRKGKHPFHRLWFYWINCEIKSIMIDLQFMTFYESKVCLQHVAKEMQDWFLIGNVNEIRDDSISILLDYNSIIISHNSNCKPLRRGGVQLFFLL